MKYIKLFEKNTKFKYMVDDYVKILPDAGPRIDMKKREKMIYKIISGRKKAQGWADDANVYLLKQAYEPFKTLKWEFNEVQLRDLTEEEREELELRLAANKYNL